jgi:lambda repressor-like predicted transcriptional regulator
MPSPLIENFVDLFRSQTIAEPDAGSVVDTLRNSTTARWRCTRQLRANTRSMLAARRSSRHAAARAIRQALQRHRAAIIASLRRRGGGAELWAETDRSAGPADDALRSQVLRSIQSHSEGVAALDIANELGVDWRRVRGAAQALVSEGAIEQVEQELYPARKGNRT